MTASDLSPILGDIANELEEGGEGQTVRRKRSAVGLLKRAKAAAVSSMTPSGRKPHEVASSRRPAQTTAVSPLLPPYQARSPGAAAYASTIGSSIPRRKIADAASPKLLTAASAPVSPYTSSIRRVPVPTFVPSPPTTGQRDRATTPSDRTSKSSASFSTESLQSTGPSSHESEDASSDVAIGSPNKARDIRDALQTARAKGVLEAVALAPAPLPTSKRSRTASSSSIVSSIRHSPAQHATPGGTKGGTGPSRVAKLRAAWTPNSGDGVQNRSPTASPRSSDSILRGSRSARASPAAEEQKEGQLTPRATSRARNPKSPPSSPYLRRPSVNDAVAQRIHSLIQEGGDEGTSSHTAESQHAPSDGPPAQPEVPALTSALLASPVILGGHTAQGPLEDDKSSISIPVDGLSVMDVNFDPALSSALGPQAPRRSSRTRPREISCSSTISAPEQLIDQEAVDVQPKRPGPTPLQKRRQRSESQPLTLRKEMPPRSRLYLAQESSLGGGSFGPTAASSFIPVLKAAGPGGIKRLTRDGSDVRSSTESGHKQVGQVFLQDSTAIETLHEVSDMKLSVDDKPPSPTLRNVASATDVSAASLRRPPDALACSPRSAGEIKLSKDDVDGFDGEDVMVSKGPLTSVVSSLAGDLVSPPLFRTSRYVRAVRGVQSALEHLGQHAHGEADTLSLAGSTSVCSSPCPSLSPSPLKAGLRLPDAEPLQPLRIVRPAHSTPNLSRAYKESSERDGSSRVPLRCETDDTMATTPDRFEDSVQVKAGLPPLPLDNLLGLCAPPPMVSPSLEPDVFGPLLPISPNLSDSGWSSRTTKLSPGSTARGHGFPVAEAPSPNMPEEPALVLPKAYVPPMLTDLPPSDSPESIRSLPNASLTKAASRKKYTFVSASSPTYARTRLPNRPGGRSSNRSSGRSTSSSRRRGSFSTRRDTSSSSFLSEEASPWPEVYELSSVEGSADGHTVDTEDEGDGSISRSSVSTWGFMPAYFDSADSVRSCSSEMDHGADEEEPADISNLPDLEATPALDKTPLLREQKPTLDEQVRAVPPVAPLKTPELPAAKDDTEEVVEDELDISVEVLADSPELVMDQLMSDHGRSAGFRLRWKVVLRDPAASGAPASTGKLRKVVHGSTIVPAPYSASVNTPWTSDDGTAGGALGVQPLVWQAHLATLSGSNLHDSVAGSPLTEHALSQLELQQLQAQREALLASNHGLLGRDASSFSSGVHARTVSNPAMPGIAHTNPRVAPRSVNGPKTSPPPSPRSPAFLPRPLLLCRSASSQRQKNGVKADVPEGSPSADQFRAVLAPPMPSPRSTTTGSGAGAGAGASVSTASGTRGHRERERTPTARSAEQAREALAPSVLLPATAVASGTATLGYIASPPGLSPRWEARSTKFSAFGRTGTAHPFEPESDDREVETPRWRGRGGGFGSGSGAGAGAGAGAGRKMVGDGDAGGGGAFEMGSEGWEEGIHAFGGQWNQSLLETSPPPELLLSASSSLASVTGAGN